MIRTVLITAGGTSEPIDQIRSITNKSTGKLGSLIADRFIENKAIDKIYYIYGKGSIIPSVDKVTPIEIETVNEFLAAVETLLSTKTIDAVVHTMAVSDYRVKTVSCAEDVLKAAKAAQDTASFTVGLERSELQNGNKPISLQTDSPVLLLERTPKILPLFRKMAPKAVIVNFKRLAGVTNQNLINTAYKSLLKNGCDYVFAVDNTSSEHEGYLITPGRFVFPESGDENIARIITSTVLGKENE